MAMPTSKTFDDIQYLLETVQRRDEINDHLLRVNMAVEHYSPCIRVIARFRGISQRVDPLPNTISHIIEQLEQKSSFELRIP